MYPTLLVFASLVAAIASVGSQDTSSNEPVNAWKTVTLPGAFYLMYRSSENDDGFGGTAKCVSIQLSEANEGTKTTTSTIKYKDPNTSKMTEKTVRITVAGSGGDTIRIGNAEGAAPENKFVFSDYGTCDVVVVSGTDGKKCELWVSAQALTSGGDTSDNKNINKCKQEYDNQCANQKKYQIYDEGTCSSK
ncbi:female-specific histamine-binding protein 2-like [Ixodes scapularis]|uniref:female-specific histamine-binding protein 2-like n=1 Tax=Ixodes scapularis TaxID=6945 RepID=UPI001A9E119E|nr:female-specific histamine-binding protein 2-like [Ixodes scapularis]